MKSQLSGLFNITKPAGITSYKVVETIKQVTGIQKVGHTGTLDPFASGILVLCLDKACRLAEYIKNEKKTYIADIILGIVTDTYDKTGIKENVSPKEPDLKEIENIIESFSGEQFQLPPMFSAKKIKGKRLYHYARDGETIERASQKINIYGIELQKYKYPLVKIKVTCSAGTYIRVIGNDIGSKLETGAYVDALTRTGVGNFNIEESTPLNYINKENWQNFLLPSSLAVNSLPKVILDIQQIGLIKRGLSVYYDKGEGKDMAIACVSENEDVIAIAKYSSKTSELIPQKVFV
ncbi:MAG: tRNA pseudouridine(55) synthase TruB [bacterium]|nr:tRNA pseudouridine(55) synthase TruB [bacterium]